MKREEAIEILKGAIKKPNTQDGYLGQALTMGIKALENQKTGYWIIYRLVPNGYDHIKCSVCGQYWSVADHSKFFKYCFNCGIKMEGVKHVL